MVYLKKIFPLSLFIILGLQNCGAHTPNYDIEPTPEELTEFGSNKPAYTIYTNPGEDCATSMNISWGSPKGTKCAIEVKDEVSGKTFLYEEDEPVLDWEDITASEPEGDFYELPFVYTCKTFDNIPSKLKNNKSVEEKHIFDKHGYELYDLRPDRDYSYRIITFDPVTDEKEYSDIYRFHTAGSKSWKAAVIGDFHHYAPLPKRLQSAMEMLDVIDSVSDGFDWVLSTGDVVAHGGSYNYWTELSQQKNMRNYMWATVQGNHDHMASNHKTSDSFFRDTHFFPYNGYRGQEGVSYWFRYGDVLFIMLNNEAMHSKTGLENALEWLEDVVEENPSKYIVVVQHYQWLAGIDGKDMQLKRFAETFDKLGVDLAIAGNNHVYVRSFPLKNNEVVPPEDGTVYVVTPSSDNERGRNMNKIIENEDIIACRWSEGPKTVGGMLMDVNSKRILMTLYDRYGEVVDSFSVPAKI